MRYELQLQMWGRVKNVSKENVFLHSSKLVFFSSLTDEKRKKRRLMRKDDRSDAIFRRIDPVPSFFSFFGKKLYFKLTSSMSYGFQFSDFCIVFFIFQRVQSLKGSNRVEWLRVDSCLSEIKLELVIDNPILLRWDIKYVFRRR